MSKDMKFDVTELQRDVTNLDKRLKAVEKDSHPPVDFDKIFKEIMVRVEKLEEAILRLEP